MKTLALVVAIHVLAGLALATVSVILPTRNVTVTEALLATAVIGAQILLLAAWTGLSDCRWYCRVILAFLGIGYLGSVASACGRSWEPTRIAEGFTVIALPTVLITIFFLAVRRFVARLSDEANYKRGTVPLQFSILSLLLVTTGVAAALAAGRTIRFLGSESLGIAVLVGSIAVFGALAMLVLLWTGLGDVSPIRRLPAGIGLAALLGLFPPYFIGGPHWRSRNTE
ncbi:MAG: hypothetical protein HQ582_23725 [Planctomycetes bacterium]|nr:hypothetical protein [Planctomycetota bacterium]